MPQIPEPSINIIWRQNRPHYSNGDTLRQLQRGAIAEVSWRTKHVDCVCMCPVLSLTFSVCVQGKSRRSSSRSAMLARVRLAMIWLERWKLMHTNVMLSKHSPTSKASQQRMRVAECLLRFALIAVAASTSLAPGLERGSPQKFLTGTGHVIANEQFEVSRRCQGLIRIHMFVLIMLQDGTEHRMLHKPGIRSKDLGLEAGFRKTIRIETWSLARSSVTWE